MKKSLILLPLLFCLLLCGCGNAARQRYEEFSADLSERDTLSFTVDLTASYPDRSAAFQLQYSLEDDQQRITVLSPERISGITARVEKGGTTLEYDGLILDTGDLDGYGLTPMSALPLLVDALQHGCADAFWSEEGRDAVELLYDDTTTIKVWFDEHYVPCRAEWVCEGRVTVSCEIHNWS